MLIKMGQMPGSEWADILVRLRDIWRAAGRDISKLSEAKTEYFDTEMRTPAVRPAAGAFTNPI
jgi:hypothetical protein